VTRSIIVSLILASACAVDYQDPEPSGPPPDSTVYKLAANALLPGKITGSTWGAQILTPSLIASTTNTQDGRDLLTYLLGCALKSGSSITAQQTAFPYQTYTFYGAIGLGTDWQTRSLTTAERHWVSACVLARANYFGTSINISLQGSHPGLAIDLDQDYHVDEGAFWGDILSGTLSEHSCMGVDQAHDNTQSDLPYRKCAAGGSQWCNFTFHNNCNTYCSTSTFPYAGCGGAQEVISVKLYGNPD
jgi:hypothetical protein